MKKYELSNPFSFRVIAIFRSFEISPLKLLLKNLESFFKPKIFGGVFYASSSFSGV